MNIKILSMQRVVNYGSFMQAYALKKVIEAHGHQVTFCDFVKGAPRHLGVKVKKVTLAQKVFNLHKLFTQPKSYIGNRNFRKSLKKSYVKNALPQLGVSTKNYNDYSCDLMIIGSDEVFNYTQNHAFGYVPALFGHGVNATSIIAYAASAGYANYVDVESDGMQTEISSGLAKFDAIGVRDKNTFDLVSKYAKATPQYVIDPTLLYDFNDEVSSFAISSHYLLVYAYGGRIDAAIDVKKILDFARSKGLRVVSVGFYNDWCHENIVVKPFELLSVFKNASYVVTDTFHGTIFAIKNNKAFVSIIQGENKWGSNAGKLGFLLEQLSLTDRIIRRDDDLTTSLDAPINYVQVNQALAELRKKSLHFLKQALLKAEEKSQLSDLINGKALAEK
jgi:Polysaccharide pyruvyl transferase